MPAGVGCAPPRCQDQYGHQIRSSCGNGGRDHGAQRLPDEAYRPGAGGLGGGDDPRREVLNRQVTSGVGHRRTRFGAMTVYRSATVATKGPPDVGGGGGAVHKHQTQRR